MTAGELRGLVAEAVQAAFGGRGDAILARVDRWIWASVAMPPLVARQATHDHELGPDMGYGACAWCTRGWNWVESHLDFRALGGGRLAIGVFALGRHVGVGENDEDPAVIVCGPCLVLASERLEGGDGEPPDAMVLAEAVRALAASGSPRAEEAIGELERRSRAPSPVERVAEGRCRTCRGDRVPVVQRVGVRGSALCADCLAQGRLRYREALTMIRGEI